MTASNRGINPESEHVHAWQANGNVVEDRLLLSPVSIYDHQKQRVTYAVQSCECGKVKRTVVAADPARFVNRGSRITVA